MHPAISNFASSLHSIIFISKLLGCSFGLSKFIMNINQQDTKFSSLFVTGMCSNVCFGVSSTRYHDGIVVSVALNWAGRKQLHSYPWASKTVTFSKSLHPLSQSTRFFWLRCVFWMWISLSLMLLYKMQDFWNWQFCSPHRAAAFILLCQILSTFFSAVFCLNSRTVACLYLD